MIYVQILMNNLKKQKNILSNNINHIQTHLNQQYTQRKKQEENKSFLNGKNVRFNDENKNNNLAHIYHDQIELKNLQKTADLVNSRILEEEHLSTFPKRFPYEVESVEVKEDVLERYRGRDYLDQSRMLEKFKKQAENAKRKTRHVKSISKQKEYFIEKPKTIPKKEKKKKNKSIEESYELNKIADMMGKLSNQIHNNSYTLDRSLEELRRKVDRQKQKKKTKTIKLPPIPRNYDDILLEKVQKIPIIVYKDKQYDARLYFSDTYKKVPQIEYDGEKSYSQYKDIVAILRANEQRLYELAKYE